MEKYLGNKRGLLKVIHEFIKKNCKDSSSLCDIFSGTTNTGRFFNNKGYKIYSNDINRFSYIIARCYFGLDSYPLFSSIKLPSSNGVINEIDNKYLNKLLKKDDGLILAKFNLSTFLKENNKLIDIIYYLNNIEKYRKSENRFIENYYTIYGSKSEFKSVRGTQGKRNYFSKENASKLDLILEQLREWYQLNIIDDNEIAILLTSVIEEVVLVANVNGTFHDFNRDKLWPNALQNFTLKLPLYELGNGTEIYCDDALRVIKNIPNHDILYIDPPYNFRQYTSYYHFLNFISAYPFLQNIENYLDNISFVRGQNMIDDFTSEFSFQDKFIDALKRLIIDSNSKYVIMNYYGGRNHWNHWSKEDELNDYGFQQIEAIFKETNIFKTHKAEALFQKRQNYQSRVGEKKDYINEYLFFGEKQTKPDKENISDRVLYNENNLSCSNQAFGLHYFKATPNLDLMPIIA